MEPPAAAETPPRLHLHRLPNGGAPAPAPAAPPPPSSWLEVRLFYVRVSPCATAAAVPQHLTLSHLRREIGVSLEINGARVPPSDPTCIPLRRDRLDATAVTYVSTDAVRLSGAAEFSVSDDKGNLILCGSMERLDAPWSDKDQKTGWSMDCCSAASIASSGFVVGVSSPSIEVYVAGCFAGFPLILTQTIQLSPRRKAARIGNLDAIPEDEDLHRPRLLAAEGEIDQQEPDMKLGHGNYYPEGWYTDDDGQLSWFNAGVRVGVGIGLGMCVGIGIGVGLLMRSYQATTRSFKRRFF